MSAFAFMLWACLAGPNQPTPEGPASAAAPIEVAESGGYVIMEAAPASAFAQPKPRAVEFRGGVILMERLEATRSRPVEGGGVTTIIAPTRIRAQLEARSGNFRALAQIQDARDLGDPIGPTRAGFHQLFGQYEGEVARGTLLFRAGRQELIRGNRHLFANSPWSAGQRSWDALFLGLTGTRAGFGLFAGSLARPLASANMGLIEHLRDQVALALVLDGYIELREALTIEGLFWGDHRSDPSGDRNFVTSSLRLYGELAPGLSYDTQGDLQLGLIQRVDLVQQHVAGHAFATLDYSSPRELGRARAKPGAFVLFDYASGSKCTTTQYTALEPCTEGVDHDFDSPYMARHRWFGWADRFRAQNVIDAAVGVRVQTQQARELTVSFELSNHVFAFAQPGGRWHDTRARLIGVQLDNRNPWAANELDLVIALRRDWFSFDVGWMLVANLAGGRAVSGEALRQFMYARVTIELWSPWT